MVRKGPRLVRVGLAQQVGDAGQQAGDVQGRDAAGQALRLRLEPAHRVAERCARGGRSGNRLTGEVVDQTTDETGDVQPARRTLIAQRGSNGYFHCNAIVSWGVDEDGDVTHVYA